MSRRTPKCPVPIRRSFGTRSASGCALSLVAALAMAPSGVHASREVVTAPRPAWVVPVAVPEARRGIPTAAGGSEILLFDAQENGVLATRESYIHVAVHVLNEQGVQSASQISEDFDPAFQTLVFHQVDVHRAGKRIAHLDPGKWKVLQREQRLEYQIYDGRLTAVLLLEDIRVGDIVEFAYTVRGVNPDIAGDCDFLFRLGSDVPIERFEQRLLWNPSRPLTIRRLGAAVPEPGIEKGPALRYVWSLSPLPATDVESDLPLGYDPFPMIQLSSLASWSDVALWGSRLYTPHASPEVQQKIREIRAAAGDGMKGALAAIRFVQDEVRYLAVELGEGSLRPTNPGTVLVRRYGDCKDKSLLLVTLLRGLGWKADPALVSTMHGPELAKFAPSRRIFDHVIVRVERGGHPYWIDATIQGQRGSSLSNLWTPPYGYALVLRPGVDRLESVQASPQAEGLTMIERVFDATDYHQPAQLRVETSYCGASAEMARRLVRSQGLHDMETKYLAFYDRTYPGVESHDSLRVADDEELNILKITERYVIPRFWKPRKTEKGYIAIFTPIEILEMIPSAPGSKRTMPLFVDLPRHVLATSRIELPQAWRLDTSTETIENAGFRLKVTSSSAGTSARTSVDLERLQRSLPPQAVEAYARDLGKIENAITFTVASGLPSGRGVNWFGAAFLALILGGSLFGATTLYRLQPAGLPAPDGAPSSLLSEGALESGPREIGGPLYLLAIGLTFGPIFYLARSADLFKLLEAHYWDTAIHSGKASSLGMGLVLGFEATVNVASIVAAALMLVLFAQRRRTFPRWFIWYMLLIIGATVADLGLGAAFARLDPDPKEVAGLMRVAVSTLVWGAYLLNAKRVRETFVR